MLKREEFLKAYDSYSDAVFRHCYFRVFDRERALDLTQEAYLKTWEYLAAGNSIQNIRAFLYKVANNLIIDESRKKKTVSLDELSEQGFDPGFEEGVKIQTALDADSVLALLKNLDEKYQQVVWLRYVEDLSPKQVAEIVGQSENVVSVRIHRGIEQLKKFLASK